MHAWCAFKMNVPRSGSPKHGWCHSRCALLVSIRVNALGKNQLDTNAQIRVPRTKRGVSFAISHGQAPCNLQTPFQIHLSNSVKRLDKMEKMGRPFGPQPQDAELVCWHPSSTPTPLSTKCFCAVPGWIQSGVPTPPVGGSW